jgi:hypothetical protein
MPTSTTTTTTGAGTSKGTRLAPALDQRLAGSEPLLDVAASYATQYNTVLSGDERVDDTPSDNEIAALAVHIAQGKADFCIWCSRRQGDVCGCFAMLAAARAAYAGTPARPV